LIPLPEHLGTAVVHECPPEWGSGARSYTHDGRCLECKSAPGYALACDVEALDTHAARETARRLGLDVREFLVYWTRLEVDVKLLELPIGALLTCRRRLARPEHDGHLRTWLIDDLVVSVGKRAVRPACSSEAVLL
jgi:hypothetical protein